MILKVVSNLGDSVIRPIDTYLKKLDTFACTAPSQVSSVLDYLLSLSWFEGFGESYINVVAPTCDLGCLVWALAFPN